MYTTFLFDFYDVIRIDPYKKWLRDHGFKREGEFYDVAAQYDRGMLDFEGLMGELSRLSGERESEIDKAFKSANNFDEDVIYLISRLKLRFKIGMISNAGGPGLRVIIKEKGIVSLFDEIIISGEVGYIKPEPEIFYVALERLNSRPYETIFVDDNLLNCISARDLGIKSLQFTGYSKLINDLELLGIELKD